jgi:hypothetical protein
MRSLFSAPQATIICKPQYGLTVEAGKPWTIDCISQLSQSFQLNTGYKQERYPECVQLHHLRPTLIAPEQYLVL